MKYKLYIIAIFLFCFQSFYSNAQIIITIAGNGTSGSDGDGGQAINASFNWPGAVAINQSGTLYIDDIDNNVIRKVNSSGFLTTYAGNGLIGYVGDGFNASIARFNSPTDVALDPAGNLYIADDYNHVVRRVNDTTNVITTYAGNGFVGTGTGGYSGDGGPAVAAEFYFPVSITFDRAGNLYISDTGNSVIRKVDASGTITTIAGMSMVTGYSGDGGAAIAAKLNSPMGLAADNAGNLFIADHFNNVIRKINPAGIISTVAGTGFHNGSADHTGGYTGDGGQATNAELSLPADVAVDASGNLFIADQYNHAIRKVNTAGIISTVAGTGTAGHSGDGGLASSAELNFPQGITINSAGDIFIADLNNNVIREVKADAAGVARSNAVANNVQLVLNPNKGVFQVSGTMAEMSDQSVLLEVMNMQGQVVYKNSLAAQNGNINTQVILNEELPNGVYLLRVSTGSETSVSRFVLEK